MSLAAPEDAERRWVKILDQTRCIGCHACTTACKSENSVPVGVTRTYVKAVDVGMFPQVRRAFQVTRCNQCDDPPCVAACPTEAMHRRPDGIVDFDKSICIGCKACMAACPYDAIFINPEDHSAEKCNFCAHRIEIGLEPACVVVCPTEAIRVGDLSDVNGPAAAAVYRQPVQVRRPEKETRPKVFYLGAHKATLDPLGASRPEGGLYAWAGQGLVRPGQRASGKLPVVRGRIASPRRGRIATSGDRGPGPRAGGRIAPPRRGRSAAPGGKPRLSRRSWHLPVGAGHPYEANTSGEATVAYDVPHQAPWDWRVSLYTWTKGIAAGAYLVPLLLVLSGQIPWSATLFEWVGPLVALGALGATGILLVWDLEHPERFYLIFLRHHWRSWLVRGAFVIGAYSGVLVLQLVASGIGSSLMSEVLACFGLPLALMTAAYTAYLFAQAKARDLWQSPLLPPQLVAQALMLGTAVSYFAARALGQSLLARHIGIGLTGLAAIDVLLVVGELTIGHVTAHARLAADEILFGRFARFFWVAAVLLAISISTHWIGLAGAGAAFVGVLPYEHSFVQGGQAVPLA